MPSERVPLSQFRKHARASVPEGNFTGEKPSFILYSFVLMIALLKDLLDLVLLGSLPGIGTVVTMCFTFFIWLLLFVFDRSGGRHNSKMFRGVTLLLVGLVEGLGFGLNFIPIETLTVILLYQMARKAYKKQKKEAERNQSSSAYA